MEATIAGANEMAASTTVKQPPAPAVLAGARARSTSTTRHWRVLRNALVAKTRDEATDTTASSVSTEFFPQFGSELYTASDGPAPHAAPSFEWHAYSIDKAHGADESTRVVLVHEKQKRQKVSLSEIFSHKINDGVDNTGNIRTWPSEQVLLSYLLRNNVVKASAARLGGRVRCCELGAGMAGLASLGLVAHDGEHIETLLVSDGNPQAVENLKVCVEENQKRGNVPEATTVAAGLLRWDRSREFPPAMKHQFDLLFASDCLFFEGFHEDLAYTISSLLKPKTGVCLLMQPSRNRSLERFVAIASAPQLELKLRIVHDYDAEISRKHREFVASSHPDYVPDVHYPVLLQVTSG